MAARLDRNYLVISDLHLGEDLRPAAPGISYLRHIARLERELERFLDHHLEHRLDGLPWCLVVNGDMVDFMSMVIFPEEPEGHSADDVRFGLGAGEAQAVEKLEHVVRRHAGVFRKLGDFVRAGNELVVVLGNHDVEFQYADVQERFLRALASDDGSGDSRRPGSVEGLHDGPEAQDKLRRAVRFCPWFYYLPDLLYIEHGHQYDEYCSFDYQLYPVADQGATNRKSGVALSMAHAGMRYFASQLPEYDPRTAEHWGMVDYAKWAWACGVEGAIRLCYTYGLLVWRVVELWYSLFDRNLETMRREVHNQRLRKLSSEWQITEERLVALDGLRRLPVIKRLTTVLSTLFLDRVLLGVAFVLTAGALALTLPGWWRLGGPLIALAAFAGLNDLLGRLRLESPSARMRAAPNLIRDLVSASIIVFGHSHLPEAVSLDGGAVYYNTGSWASEDEHAFTHLVIRAQADDGPRAELRQWRDGESAPYPLVPPLGPKVG